MNVLVAYASRLLADHILKAAQLAARAGIQIAHPAHDDVRLVIEIQTIADDLVEIDFRRQIGTAIPAGSPARTSATWAGRELWRSETRSQPSSMVSIGWESATASRWYMRSAIVRSALAFHFGGDSFLGSVGGL